jgi:hypothetical protein
MTFEIAQLPKLKAKANDKTKCNKKTKEKN